MMSVIRYLHWVTEMFNYISSLVSKSLEQNCNRRQKSCFFKSLLVLLSGEIYWGAIELGILGKGPKFLPTGS